LAYSVSGLSLSGIINDRVKETGDGYQVSSLLDLVFTSEIDIKVDTSPDSLVMPDKYHPPLSITYSMPEIPPQLNDQHTFRNFNRADFTRLIIF